MMEEVTQEVERAISKFIANAKLEGARLALEAAHQSVAEVVNKGTADYCFGALDPAKIVGEG